MQRRARGTSLVAPPIAVTARSRSVAWLLMLLIAVPFTAPFSTCDLSALMAARDGRATAWSAPDGSTPSIDAVGAQTATGSVLEEEQFKDGALTRGSLIVHSFIRHAVRVTRRARRRERELLFLGRGTGEARVRTRPLSQLRRQTAWN